MVLSEHAETADLNSIANWEFALTLKLSPDTQYMFDYACCTSMLNNTSADSLSVSIKQGDYKIWTSIYEPDDNIPKFDTTK